VGRFRNISPTSDKGESVKPDISTSQIKSAYESVKKQFGAVNTRISIVIYEPDLNQFVVDADPHITAILLDNPNVFLKAPSRTNVDEWVSF
jgi:hypothetical protein